MERNATIKGKKSPCRILGAISAIVYSLIFFSVLISNSVTNSNTLTNYCAVNSSMAVDNFYITLPSSVKSSTYENVLSDYVTNFPKSFELEGIWEVGLAELLFTNSWYNINAQAQIDLKIDGRTISFGGRWLRPGKYDPESIVKAINEVLESMKRSMKELKVAPQLGYDIPSNKVWIKTGTSDESGAVFPLLSYELFELLGLIRDSNSWDSWKSLKLYQANGLLKPIKNLEERFKSPSSIKEKLFAEHCVDIERGIQAIYVYSDIVQENLVGDKPAHCLRVISVPNNKFVENQSFIFAEPHYYPINNRSFDSIRVTLRDRTFEKIKFRFGETLVKLHFRRLK